jgi:predicted dehydrogenase
MIRVGIVGCGRVAQQRHLPVVAGLPEADLVAICDVDGDTRQRLSQQYSLKLSFDDYRELVTNDAVDAVMIATPTQYHVDVGVAALEAGKHVIIEKPLALGLDEIDRLDAAAKDSQKTVAVAMNSRWHRLSRDARDVVRSGALGTPGLLRSVFTDNFRLNEEPRPWMMQHENAGCVLVEQAVHHFDLWQFLFDTTVEDVYAKMLDPSTVSERATVSAKLANGVIVTAMFTEGLKALNELEIYGDEGHLLLSMYDFDGLDVTPVWEYPGTMGPRIRRFKQTLRAFPGALKRKKTGGDWAGSYVAEWQHFLDCIKTGNSPECGLAEGRRALTVGLAAMASLAEDRPVRIADAPREIRPYTGLAGG